MTSPMERTVSLKRGELSQALVNSISEAVYPFVVGLIHADDLVGSGTLLRIGERRGFFNLGFYREAGLNLRLYERHGMVITGFHHEDHTTEENKDGFSVVKGFRGFAGLTRIERFREHDGYDLCDVTVDYSLDKSLP